MSMCNSLLAALSDLQNISIGDIENRSGKEYINSRKLNEEFTQTPWVKKIEGQGDSAQIGYLCFLNLLVMYLKNDLVSAVKFAKACIFYYEKGKIGFFMVPSYFYATLVWILCFEQNLGGDRSKYKKLIKVGLSKLKYWTKYCPQNCQHRYELLLAEWERVNGKNKKAIEFYNLAIKHANENNYFQKEAIANELAARFYISIDKKDLATDCLIKSYLGYKKWGAVVKVQALVKEFPDLLLDNSLNINSDEADKTSYIIGSKTFTSTSGGLTDLDLVTIKNTLELSLNDNNLEVFIKTLLDLLLQYSNSQKCSVILNKNDDWVIEGQKLIDKDPEILESLSIKDNIPETLINFISRSNKPFLLNDPFENNDFDNDVYIKNNKPKSILGLPLISNNEISGMLYLENRDVALVFTSSDVEFFKFLSVNISMYIKKLL